MDPLIVLCREKEIRPSEIFTKECEMAILKNFLLRYNHQFDGIEISIKLMRQWDDPVNQLVPYLHLSPVYRECLCKVPDKPHRSETRRFGT